MSTPTPDLESFVEAALVGIFGPGVLIEDWMILVVLVPCLVVAVVALSKET